jgi:hypothetical protein
MAAATTVVAVAVALVAVRNPPRAAHLTSPSPVASGPAQPAVTSAPVDPEALPGYFVSLDGFAMTAKYHPGTSGK